jgi:hypothetical protein
VFVECNKHLVPFIEKAQKISADSFEDMNTEEDADAIMVTTYTFH